MRSTEISNAEDVIDSRDVIARIEELEGERADLQSTLDEASEALSENDGTDGVVTEELEDAVEEAKQDLTDWDDDNGDELKALKALADEAAGYAPDWKYGETLIRDSYFQEYAQQLAADIGAINKDASWPNTCIDWEQAARELQQDYTSVEFDGVTYWVRS
jgi:DNA repair exonuclease SbcCD ATPase subunit